MAAFPADLGLPNVRRRGRRGVGASLERRLPKGLGHWLTLGFFAVIGVTGLTLGGYGAQFRTAYGTPGDALARAAGFGISRVDISGLAELSQTEILVAAGITDKSSLLLLDAADVKHRLESLPLIRQASVRKLYPDELAIQITEREPGVLWQINGEVFVTAADGTVIEPLHDARFLDLPFVVGVNANERAPDYEAILNAAGSLKSRIRAGMLISGRRWDLKLDNGVELRLPEKGATDAIARFALLEREQRVTEKDILAVDLRIPDRIVVRLGAEAAAARAEMLKKKPKTPQKGADL
jgi:cell division protein FtsQ